MSHRWKESSLPITSLECLDKAVRKIGSWSQQPNEVRNAGDTLMQLSKAQGAAERVKVLQGAASALRARLQGAPRKLPSTIHVNVDGAAVALHLEGSRYVAGGEDNRPSQVAAQAAVSRLNAAYREAVDAVSGELKNIESRLAEAQDDLALVQEYSARRDLLLAEQQELATSQEDLKARRAEHIKARAKELGYVVREVKVGNAIQLNLVRRV
jgi:hypothetical protein